MYVSLLRLAHRARKLYWRLVRPRTLASRCILVRGNSVVLIKHVYEEGWYLPGGGLGRNESFEDAARREVREEIGVTVSNLQLLAMYHIRSEGRSDHTALFVASDFEGEPRAISAEIAAVKFAPLSTLPQDAVPSTVRGIALLRGTLDKNPL